MDYITFLIILITSNAFGGSEGAIHILILIFGGRKIKRTARFVVNSAVFYYNVQSLKVLQTSSM